MGGAHHNGRMSSLTQEQLVETLHKFERAQTRDVWGLHAAALAHGIEKSGVPALLGDLNRAAMEQADLVRSSSAKAEAQRIQQLAQLQSINSSITSLAATNAAGFDAICQAIGAQSQLLQGIQELLANPLSTAAAERYRRGLHALSQGWMDHALVEFDAALEQDPFQSLTHFAKGIALGSLGRNAEAVEAFKQAIYFTGRDHSLAPVKAGAAILGARAASEMADRETASTLLNSAAREVPNCAEVHLALASMNSDRAALERCVALAPELGPIAVFSGVQSAREVCEVLAADSTSTVAHMRAAAAAATQLTETPPPPNSTPELMSFHTQWRSGIAQKARLAAESARQQARLADDQLKSSDQSLDLSVGPTQIENTLRQRLLRGQIIVGLSGLGIVFFVLRFMESMNHPATDISYKWKWQIGGGLLILILAAVVTLQGLSLLSNLTALRKERKARQGATSTARSRREQAQTQVAAANTKLEAANSVLAHVNQSMPTRVFPLTQPH